MKMVLFYISCLSIPSVLFAQGSTEADFIYLGKIDLDHYSMEPNIQFVDKRFDNKEDIAMPRGGWNEFFVLLASGLPWYEYDKFNQDFNITIRFTINHDGTVSSYSQDQEFEFLQNHLEPYFKNHRQFIPAKKNRRAISQNFEFNIVNKFKTNILSKDSDIVVSETEMPTFPGGWDAWYAYLSNSIKYPKKARKKGIQGRVYVEVLINENGEVAYTKIVRSVDPLLDEEALRVIKNSPKFIPGYKDGKPEEGWMSLAINFRL